MDVQRLLQFSITAQRGSIGQAAQELGLTQPALTRSLQRLEAEAGGRLFERSPRGVVLTDLGETLLPYARAIVAEAERAADELAAVKGGAKSRVRIGISPNFVSYIVPEAVKRLFAQLPNVTASIVTETYENLMRMLRAYEVDVVFSQYFDNPANLDSAPGEDIRRETLFKSLSRAYVAPHHPLAARRALTLADLVDHDWAVPLQMSMVYRFDYVFRTAGLRNPLQKINTSSMAFIKTAIYDFGMAAVVPDHIMQDDVADGRAVALPVAKLVFDYRVGLSQRARGTRTPAMDALSRIFRAVSHEDAAGAANGRGGDKFI